ncbi:MAG: hypothetical protein UZ05_CHB002000870 [Chlorobi bacterium OLB5]|nr:MAG: hypothetical protein UZ05_CHB002000870 [Chlorobi bacterium OLB5]
MKTGKFSIEEAKWAGNELGIDWNNYDIEQFRMGLETELEHGLADPVTNVTGDDLIMTAKIALAHLKEIPDYYTRLKKMEAEAEAEMKLKK